MCAHTRCWHDWHSLVTLQSTYAQTTSLFHHVKLNCLQHTLRWVSASFYRNVQRLLLLHNSIRHADYCWHLVKNWRTWPTAIWAFSTDICNAAHAWAALNICTHQKLGADSSLSWDMATFYRHLPLSSELRQTRYLKLVHSTKCPWKCLIL